MRRSLRADEGQGVIEEKGTQVRVHTGLEEGK